MAKVLIIVSTPLEAQPIVAAFGSGLPLPEAWNPAVLSPEVDLVISGVGKANAAGALARSLGSDHRWVLNLGIGGILPGSPARVGEVVLGTSAVFADEGVPCSDGRFLSCAALGFGMNSRNGTDAFEVSGELVAMLGGIADQSGTIATVSECSGTDARAAMVVARTGAIAEAMEGAAVALVAARLGVEWCEIRVMSNTTGDRERQLWKIKEAIARLGEVARHLSTRLTAT